MSKRSLSDNIARKMETKIVEQMRPGEKLPPELELVERYGVGRSTIRESLKVLSAKGIITRRNEGTFVSEKINESLIQPLNLMINMDIGDVDDLLEMREILEKTSILLAARRATEEQIIEIERCNWAMNEPGLTAAELQDRDIAFHNSIAKATDNPILSEMLNAVRQVIVKHLEDPEKVVEAMGANTPMHDEIIDAIKDKEKNIDNLVKRYFADIHGLISEKKDK